jgi:phage/plasmid-like protein (TIGR03299 family)
MGRSVTNLLNRNGEAFSSTSEALVAAGLDWTLTKASANFVMRDPDDETKVITGDVPKQYALVRSDNHKALPGITVGNVYTVVDNADLFAPIDALKEVAHGTPFETLNVKGAGAFDGGRTVWMHVESPQSMFIGGDEIKRYFLAIAKHGGGNAVIYNAPERFACTNQLRSIIAGSKFSVSIGHYASAVKQLEDARISMNKLVRADEHFFRTSEQLLNETFSRNEMENLVRMLVPKPSEANPDTTDRQAKNWDNKFQSIMSAYNAADLNDNRYTKWGAINAIADWEQHWQRMKGTEADKQETLFRHAYMNGILTAKAVEILLPS